MAGTRRFFLGVDGGQSSTRAAIGDESGRILARAGGAPCHRASTSQEAALVRAAVGDLVRKSLAGAGLPPGTRFEAACFGMSGGPDDKRRILAEVVPSALIDVTTDAVAALEGAAGGGPGVVVVAGTGSIALARDAAGNEARCGGWGYLFGDDGGAFDIVRRALRASLAAEEGWGEPTALREDFLEATGSATVNEAMHRFYDRNWPRDRIASLAPQVDAAACGGDKPAREVMAGAAKVLGSLAEQAVQALPCPPPEPTVYCSGGVFRSELARDIFARAVGAAGFALGRPAHDPVVGALLLAYRARGRSVPVMDLG